MEPATFLVAGFFVPARDRRRQCQAIPHRHRQTNSNSRIAKAIFELPTPDATTSAHDHILAVLSGC